MPAKIEEARISTDLFDAQYIAKDLGDRHFGIGSRRNMAGGRALAQVGCRQLRAIDLAVRSQRKRRHRQEMLRNHVVRQALFQVGA